MNVAFHHLKNPMDKAGNIMKYILNIHTSTEEAIVNISNGEKVLATLYNNDPKQHAAFLHTAIKEILVSEKISPKDLTAIAVTKGPGSYTGIRVGLASAKGLCFALRIPLITMNTLDVMAHTLINEIQDPNALYCPMIDARRMEVFTALYDFNLKEIIPPQAIVLDSSSFLPEVKVKNTNFSGSGCLKLKNMELNIQAEFYPQITISSYSLAFCANYRLEKELFDDVAWSNAEYLKEFYFPNK